MPAALAGVPVRVHGEHGWDVHDLAGARRRYQLVRRLYRPFVHHYVALSRHLAQYLTGRIGVRESDVSQIYNGVDTERFRPAASGRARIGGSPFDDGGLWLVGTVGRLEPVKDQTNLARAFVRAVRSDSEARRRMRLVVVGDGPLRQAVQAILAEGGVRELAWLAGERADVPDVLRGLDLLRAAVARRGHLEHDPRGDGERPAGRRDARRRQRRAGRRRPDRHAWCRRPTAVRSAMRCIATSATRRRRAATARRRGERAERRFSLDRMVADYDSLYRRLLGQAARGA